MGIILAGSIAALDPISQVNKGRDAQKRNDLAAMKDAFEIFYHDWGCYPEPTQIFAGGSITSFFKAYIKELPDNYSTDYSYFPTGVSCPQWYVLKAKKSYKKDADFCQLDCAKDLTRKDYICIFGGNLGCGPDSL